MLDDAALVRQCLAGQEPSLRAFVERFQSTVFGLCFRMLGQREDAEDVAQEVFLRAFRSLHRWDAQRPLRPWLLTIAANRCRTALGRRAKRPAPSAITPEEAVAPVTTSPELAEELQRGLNELRDEYRQVFVLFYLEEMSCAEISEITKVPVGTVKTWLHRTRKELAEYFKSRGVAPEAHYAVHRI